MKTDKPQQASAAIDGQGREGDDARREGQTAARADADSAGGVCPQDYHRGSGIKTSCQPVTVSQALAEYFFTDILTKIMICENYLKKYACLIIDQLINSGVLSKRKVRVE